MTTIISGLLYTKEDEWIKIDDSEATIGVTDFAQNSLSDIVFAELPAVGDEYAAGDSFGVIESVKASAELYTPITGNVLAINESVLDEPEQLNKTPYKAWLVKMSLNDASDIEGLMDAAAYEAYCQDR